MYFDGRVGKKATKYVYVVVVVPIDSADVFGDHSNTNALFRWVRSQNTKESGCYDVVEEDDEDDEDDEDESGHDVVESNDSSRSRL